MRSVWLVSLLLVSGCGTYSTLRPADTLSAGTGELHAGLGLSARPQVVPFFIADYGFTDHLEAGFQYEVFSALIGARTPILSTSSHGIALAVGLQAGMVSAPYPLGYERRFDARLTAAPNLTLGRRFTDWELYLAYKVFLTTAERGPYELATNRLGFRYHGAFPLILTMEGGGTHFRVPGGGFQFVAEFSAGLGVRF